MTKYSTVTVVALALAGNLLAAERNSTTRRLEEASTVLTEIMNATDTSIPRELLEKAHCAVIVPGMKKAAFIVGGKFGRGFITCRQGGKWSSPGAIRVEGGSVGLQIGGTEVDLVLLVMNEEGARKLLESQFTLGGEGMVAAGPVGRVATAQTDAKLTAGILAWARARGAFAGIALQGATLRQDLDANHDLYGRRVENAEIVKSGNLALPGGSRLQTLLQGYAPVER